MMKKRSIGKKPKEGGTSSKKKESKPLAGKKKYEDERAQLKEISQRTTAFVASMEETVATAKSLSVSLTDWSSKTDSTLAATLTLVAGFQTALGDLQLKLAKTLEEKVHNPVKDMMLLERDLLTASKKDEVSRSEAMKVETFRMSIVERFCEYLEEHKDYFKRGGTLLNNYTDEVNKSKAMSRKQVEEILNTTLEDDLEAELQAQQLAPPPPIFGAPLEDTVRRDGTPIPRIVQHIIAYLDANALEQMGIFRISGHTGSVQALKEEIDSGREVELTLANNVHVVSTVFKQYLRTLPDTLTVQSRFEEWIMPLGSLTIVSDPDGNPNYPAPVLDAFTALVDALPTINAHNLDFLISFCTRVVVKSDQNMMGAKNLASLIAPNILSRQPEDFPVSASALTASTQHMLEDVSQANRVVECLILNYAHIFNNVQYALKANPIQDLTVLINDLPLNADRTLAHGAQVSTPLLDPELVDSSGQSPPSMDAPESPRSKSDLRKRRFQKDKKTLSSLSLRKIKKKEKANNSSSNVPGIPNRSTVAYDSHETAYLDRVQKSHSTHLDRIPSPMTPTSVVRAKESPDLLGSPQSDSESSSSLPTVSVLKLTPVASPPKKPITVSSSNNSTNSNSNNNSRPRKTSEGKARRPSAGQNGNSTVHSGGLPNNNNNSTSNHGTEGVGLLSRRHSITLASGEGYDPTKENFGSIGQSTPMPSDSQLALDALIDDPSTAMRSTRRSRPSVVGRGSVSGKDRPLTRRSSLSRSNTDAIAAGNHVTSKLASGTYGSKALSPRVESNHNSPDLGTLRKKQEKQDRTQLLTLLKFENPESFNTVMDERFGKGTAAVSSYVVIGYCGPTNIKMQSGGAGNVAELVSHFKDDEVQYALIRLVVNNRDGNLLARDVFIRWNGPNVSAIQKGKKQAHGGEMKLMLAPHAVEILASSKDNFTEETVIDRSTPGSSHVID